MSSESSDGDDDVEVSTRFTLEVPEGVEKLGFTPSAMPPAAILVLRMEAAGWAEENGVQIEDELISVDDALVNTMSKQELVHKLKDGPRPLSLTFVRKGGVIPAGKTLTLPSGDSPDCQAAPESRFTCFNKAPFSWKVSIPHYLVRCWLASAALQDLLQHEDGESYVVPVPAGVSALGFSTSRESHVSVCSVVPESWAFQQGIAVGDKLLRLGLIFTSTLSLEDLRNSLMQVRPLQLFLLRPASSARGQVVNGSASLAPKSSEPASIASKSSDEHKKASEGETRRKEDAAFIDEKSDEKSKQVEAKTTPAKRRPSVTFHPDVEEKQQEQDHKDEEQGLSIEQPLIPDGVPYTITVDEGVVRLGFVPNFTRDDAFDSLVVEVTRVETQCWAQEKGVQKGDYLLMLSQDPVASMTKKEIIANLKAYRRPLHLTFLRPHSGMTKIDSIPIDQVSLAASTLSKAYASSHRRELTMGSQLSTNVSERLQRVNATMYEKTGGDADEHALEAPSIAIDALKELATKFVEERRFVIDDTIEVWSNSHTCWCTGRIDKVLNRGRVDVEYHVPDGGLSAKELFCEDNHLRLANLELGPWPLEKEDENEQKSTLQVDSQRIRAELNSVRQEAALSASLANWRDKVQKMQNDPLQDQLAKMQEALEASSKHLSLQEQVIRAEAKAAQIEKEIHSAELRECNRLAVLALEDIRSGFMRRGSTHSTMSIFSEAEGVRSEGLKSEGCGSDESGFGFGAITSMFQETPQVSEVADVPQEVAGWFGNQFTHVASMIQSITQENIEAQGWLEQRGPSVEYGWTSRWCILVNNEIRIYTSPACTEKRKGILLDSLDSIMRVTDRDAPGDAHLYRSSRPNSFVVCTRVKDSEASIDGNSRRTARYSYFDAGNAQALQEWTSAIDACINDEASDLDDPTMTTNFDVWQGQSEMKKEFEQALANLKGEMVDPRRSEHREAASKAVALKRIRTRSFGRSTCSAHRASSRRVSLDSKSSTRTPGEAPKGVSVFHVKEELVMMGLNSAGLSDSSSMHEVEEKVIRPKSAKVECPVDGKMGAAYVHCVEGIDHVGASNYYISYAGTDSIGQIAEALEQNCKTKDVDPKRTYVWVCSFCINQHRIHEHSNSNKQAEDIEATIKDRMWEIGHVLAIYTPWERPSYTNRAWCLLELSTALDLGPSICKTTVLLPPQQDASLCQILERGRCPELEAAWQQLGDINVESASCTLEQDKTRIPSLISKNGVEEANLSVANIMRQWLVTHSEAHFTRLLARGLQGERAALMCEALSWLHQSAQHLDRAGALLEEGLRILNTTNGNSSPLAARLHYSLGRVKDEKDDLNGAYDAYRSAKIIYQRNSILKSEEGVNLLHDMGIVQASMDRCEDAITSYKEACAIQRELGKMDTNDSAMLFNSLGVAHYRSGSYRAALDSYEEARRIRDGTNTMDTTYGASIWHNIGVVYEALEDNAGALRAYLAAKLVHEKLGTLDSMDCADTLEAILALEDQEEV